MAKIGPIRAFLSYAHEDHGWRDRVLMHLGWLRNSGRLEHFDDRQLKPGESWDSRIQGELDEADIVIVLISPYFVGSAYCGLKELLVALDRAEQDAARIVPIVCDHVDLGALPIAHLQCTPQDEQNDLKPLVDWPNFNVPLAAIAATIRGIVQELEHARSTTLTDSPAAAPLQWSLPSPPPRCFGRGEPTRRIVEALLHEPPDPIVLHGPAGIGKTTLALEAACHPEVVERFADRRAFVALDKAPDADALLSALRAAVALPPSPDGWDDLEPLLEEDLVLLVLDNLEMPWERAEQAVEGVIARLCAIPSVLLIAAMRGGQPPLSPAWKLALEVAPLSPPDARTLLLAHAPKAADETDLLETALAGLDGVPLAIELFAAQVAGQGSLRAAWQQWSNQRRPRGQPAEPKSPLAVSLDFALASPRLDEVARRLYAALGRLPQGWQADRVDQLLPQPVGDAAQRLVQASLVRQEAGRLAMLGPVRDHALAQALPAEDEQHLNACLLVLADALPLQQAVAADPALCARARGELANMEAALGRLRPEAPAERHGLGWRWMQVGDTHFGRGNLSAALRAYQAAGQQFRSCVQQEPAQPRWQRSTAVAMLRSGDVHRDQGDLVKARRAYESAAQMLGAVADLEPGQRQWRRDLAVARSALADVLLAQADVAGAAMVHTSALDVLQALARAEPADTAIQRDLLVAWAKVGQLRLRQQDRPAALSAHAAAAEIAATLAAREPHNREWQRDLSVARLGAGDAHRESGDLAAALTAYTEGLAIRERLAAAAPDDLRHQRDLAVALERVAVTRHALGDTPGALGAWRQALAISEGLAAAHPDNVGLGLARVTHLHGIAQTLDPAEPGAREEAAALLQRGLALLNAAAAAGRLDAERQAWIGPLQARLAALTDQGAVGTAPSPSQQAGRP